MNNLVPQTSVLVQSLGIALLHSLWQCLLLYLVLQTALALIGKNNARMRYICSMGALVLMFLWFLDTWAGQWQVLNDAFVTIYRSGTDKATLTSIAKDPVVIINYNSDTLRNLLPKIQPYLPLAVMIYLAGMVLMLLRFGMGIYQVKRLRSRGITTLANDWGQWLMEQKEHLQISRPVQLCYSVYAKVPMTIGTLRPLILLPFSMASGLSTEQIETILLHELAHIKRNDYLLNMLQATIETLLFFNPFIWLCSAAIRREREHCCDDLVLAHHTDPLPYAKALATLEACRRDKGKLALAASGNKNKLFNRIKRIMEMKNQKNENVRAMIAAIFIAVIMLSFAWFSPSFAQSHKAKVTSRQKSSATSADAGKHTNNVPGTPHTPQPPAPGKAPAAPESSEAAEPAEAPAPPDVADVDETVSKAMDNVDWEEIDNEMKNANKEMAKANEEIAKVNWEQVNRELANAQKELDAINWKDIQKEIDNGLKEARSTIDDPRLRKEVTERIADARRQSLKAVARANNALVQAQLSAGQSRQNAIRSYNVAIATPGAVSGSTHVYSNGNGYNYAYGKGSSINAHAGRLHEIMLQKMESEGLIDRSGSYKVEKYSDRLYINGQLQPDDVYRRYSRYLKDENLTIKGDRDHIRISVKN